MAKDGTVFDLGGISAGVLGGIESENEQEKIDEASVEALADHPGPLDILLTHQNPYGASGRRYRGYTGGPHQMTGIVKRLRPKYLFNGHIHRAAGPFRVMDTYVYGVDGLMTLLRDTPEHDIIPGCIMIFDTNGGMPYYPCHPWFLKYSRETDIPLLLKRAMSCIG